MDRIVVFATLALALGLFSWGRIRHDLVALIALFVLVAFGIVPPVRAFEGFAHPAVITVAAVLIIGKALQYSGLIDLLGKWVMRVGKKQALQIAVLSCLVALASAFMNNVGALTIMMPVAVHMAGESGYPPSRILMPIAFASLLGGMTTLIGTPPNIIIATFRAGETGSAFGLFDFAPVGLGVAVAGLLFIILAGWRLLPERSGKKQANDRFRINDYITEVKVKKDSKGKGLTLKAINGLGKADVQILGLVRRKKRIHAPDESEELKTGDVLILETEAEELKTFLDNTGLSLAGGKQFRKDAEGSKHITVLEAVITPDSPLTGKTARTIRLRSRYGLNLLAVARRETRIRRRLDHVVFRAGDVLLLQGRAHLIDDILRTMGCLPLAPRDLRIGYRRKIILSLSVFIASIVTILTGLLPVQIAFSMAALAMILTGVLPAKDAYSGIDWPVIILLGAMIPVGAALETTGGAGMIAEHIVDLGTRLPVWGLLTIILLITMFMSDIINNAATVVLMAPVAVGVAHGLSASIDPFLMAVALGGSCAFLTPIGHQSNTLVMGPGGYKFTDYSRMGLPLEIIIVLIGVPLILFFWPV